MSKTKLQLLVFLGFFLSINLIDIPWGYSQISPLEQTVWTQARQIVNQTLRSRDGVVLWQDLQSGEQKVLGNSALLQQSFLPGSVMKLLTAEAALQQGVELNYHCQGHESFSGAPVTSGDVVQWCWEPNGHGDMDLSRALAHSCNLYFAKLGTQLNWSAFKKLLQSYSFAANQDLEKNFSETPPPLNLFAIGEKTAPQNLFKVTPQEMAFFWEHYLEKLSQPRYERIRRGLVLAGEIGTGKLAAQGLDFKILVKTGTADSERPDYKTHAWLLAAYPAEKPRYALVIFLRNAHAYEEAARLAGKIIKILTPLKSQLAKNIRKN